MPESAGLDVVDRVVDHLVRTDVDAFLLGELARVLVGPDVEADHDRVRGHRERDVVLGDRRPQRCARCSRAPRPAGASGARPTGRRASPARRPSRSGSARGSRRARPGAAGRAGWADGSRPARPRGPSTRARTRCGAPRARRRPRGTRRPTTAPSSNPGSRRASTDRPQSTAAPFSSCIARILQ